MYHVIKLSPSPIDSVRRSEKRFHDVGRWLNKRAEAREDELQRAQRIQWMTARDMLELLNGPG